MPVRYIERVSRYQRVETMPVRLWKQTSREAHGAKHARGELALESCKGVLEEAVIEARVVRNEHAAGEHLKQIARDRRERRCALHHVVGNARQRLDCRRNGKLRVDERAPFADALGRIAIMVDAYDADFGDAIVPRGRPGGFEIDEREGGSGQQRITLDGRTFVRYSNCMSNDRSYLGTLQDYYARHRALPSYSSIGGLLGLRSKSSVAALVARMKLAGFLESTPDRRLAPTKRFFARPIAAGFVRAGLPDPVTDDEPDAVTLDDYLIERPSQTVLVRVKGDSMIDAGIFEGDLVVVEKRAAAQKGEIVVAIVDNQFTLKRLDLENGRFVLRPENKAYPTIRPEGQLEIFGVMVGLVRKM